MFTKHSAAFQATVIVNRDFNYLDIGNDIAIMKIVDSMQVPQAVPQVFQSMVSQGKTTQGFCTLESAKKFEAGEAESPDVNIKVNNGVDGYWTLMSRAMLNDYQKHGWLADLCDEDEIQMLTHDREQAGHISYGKYFDNLVEDPTLIPVKVDTGATMIFDINGEVEPVAIDMDFMLMALDNRHYDLDKVVAWLLRDSRIKFKSNTSGCDSTRNPLIKRLSHHSHKLDKFEYIDVIFMPTKEEANKMWKKQLSYNAAFPSTLNLKAINDLDLLKIKQFKILK